MTEIPIGNVEAAWAFERDRANRSSNCVPSPAGIARFDIFALPGASHVTSHVDWLSSIDAYNVATPFGPAADSLMGRLHIAWGIGILHPVPIATPAPYHRARPPLPHGIFIMREIRAKRF